MKKSISDNKNVRLCVCAVSYTHLASEGTPLRSRTHARTAMSDPGAAEIVRTAGTGNHEKRNQILSVVHTTAANVSCLATFASTSKAY